MCNCMKYTTVSGTLFGVIALIQALRIFNDWPMQIAGYSMPMWGSIIAVIIAGGMSVWAFRSDH